MDVLKASMVESRSIPSIYISIEHGSILDWNSIDSQLIFADTPSSVKSILAVITRSVLVDTQPTYQSLPYGWLSVACQWYIGVVIIGTLQYLILNKCCSVINTSWERFRSFCDIFWWSRKDLDRLWSRSSVFRKSSDINSSPNLTVLETLFYFA